MVVVFPTVITRRSLECVFEFATVCWVRGDAGVDVCRILYYFACIGIMKICMVKTRTDAIIKSTDRAALAFFINMVGNTTK